MVYIGRPIIGFHSYLRNSSPIVDLMYRGYLKCRELKYFILLIFYVVALQLA